MKRIILIFPLLLSGCLKDVREIQEQRVGYCQKVVQREACSILIKKGEYKNASDCVEAMEAGGFCSPPIKSTISDMNKCVIDLHSQDDLPESCAELTH